MRKECAAWMCVVCLLFAWSYRGWADQPASGKSATSGAPEERKAAAPAKKAAETQPLAETKSDEPKRPNWYLFMGNMNNHPRLDDADKRINKEINKRFRALAPGFDDVEHFKDQANDFMIWTPMAGVGYLLSDKWDVFFQVGYSAGKVPNDSTDPSFLILPLHTDITFWRSSLFVGAGANYFPLGIVELCKYTSIKQRLKGTKPFVAVAVNWNRLTHDVKVKAGPFPIGNLYRHEEHEDWNIWNTGFNLGIDVPLGEHSSMAFTAAYNIFYEHSGDFSGPSLSMLWKRYF